LSLYETSAVIHIIAEPYAVNGSFSGEMSTVKLYVDDQLIDRWPKLGPWHRSEHLMEMLVNWEIKPS
jgi:hypothetical protein